MTESSAVIGTSPPRLEAGDKATGRAQFADDVRLPGMLHAAIHTARTRTRESSATASMRRLRCPG